MIGAYGLVSHSYPTGVTGPTNRFTDIALDAQLKRPFGGGGVVVARLTWINEQQTLTASVDSGGAAQLDHTLNTAQFSVTAEPSARFGATLGYFSTTGTRDSVLYAPAALNGSQTCLTTDGFTEEFDFNPGRTFGSASRACNSRGSMAPQRTMTGPVGRRAATTRCTCSPGSHSDETW